MAVSDRVLVLRAGKLVGERARRRRPRRHELAALMVGRQHARRPRPRPQVAGERGPANCDGVDRPAAGAGRSTASRLTLRGGEITGLAGVSGNGQALLADRAERRCGAGRGHDDAARRDRSRLVAARHDQPRHRPHPRGPPRRRHDRRHERHRERHRRALSLAAFQPRAASSTGPRRAASPRRSSPTTT